MTTPTPTDADDDGDFNDQSITVSWSRINWIQIQSPIRSPNQLSIVKNKSKPNQNLIIISIIIVIVIVIATSHNTTALPC